MDVKKEQIKLVMFDVDGTLVDSIGCIIACMQNAARNCQVPPPGRLQVLNIIGITLRPAIASLFPGENDDKIDDITDEYRRLCCQWEDETPSPLFAGTLETLRQLKDAGFYLGIATGKSRHGLERLYKFAGMRDMIDFAVCGDMAASKPDPMMMHLALEHFSLQPQQALMVGDSNLDLRMAKNAKVPAVGVRCGVHSEKILLLEDPWQVVDTVKEVGQLLLPAAQTPAVLIS